MNKKPEIVPPWRNASEIRRCLNGLKAGRLETGLGSQVVVILREDAKALIEICEQLRYLERKAGNS